MKQFVLPLALMALSTTGAAQSLPESLLQCDSRFFSELNAQQSKLKHTAPLKTDKQGHAWFSTAKKGEDTVWFTQPLRMQRLTIVGYYRTEIDLNKLGTYYYWGWVVNESPKDVIAALPGSVWKKSGNEYFLNPMIKRPGDKQWQINSGAASGIAPAQDSVEKLAMLEYSEGKTKILCSIQGAVEKEDVLPLRPDLKEEEQ